MATPLNDRPKKPGQLDLDKLDLSDLRAVRRARRLLESRVELARLQHANELLENLSVWDGFGGGSDMWDRVRPTDQGQADWIPTSIVSDRQRGGNWPFWRNEYELGRFRQQARVLCGLGGYAWGMLENLVNYIVGDGCSYEVGTSDRLPDADPDQPGRQAPEWLARQQAVAQDVIDRFLRLNRWTLAQHDYQSMTPLSGSREQETVRRVFRDGEVFFRVFRQDDGTTFVRNVEPEQIVNPGWGTAQNGWSFGIQHQVQPFEDVETVLNYHVLYLDPTLPHPTQAQLDAMGEVVLADQIIHLKGPHTDSTVKRGTPHFIGDTAAALLRAGRLQDAVSTQAYIQACTAESWKFATATMAGIGSLAQGLSTRQRVNPETGKTENQERVKKGMIRRLPEGQDLIPGPANQSQSYMAAVQGDLRQGATAFCAPEYLASGDASNANYSSTKEAGTPFVRNGQAMQGYFTGGFCCVCWAALRWAAECGILEARALPYLTLTVKAPVIAMRTELERAQEDQILVPLQVKSVKTAQQERGLDPDIEEANNQEQQEKQGPAQPPLPMPGADGNLPPEPRPKKPPMPRPVKEGKDASGHEHAANGQFGTGGGSGGDKGGSGGETKTPASAPVAAAKKNPAEARAHLAKIKSDGWQEPVIANIGGTSDPIMEMNKVEVKANAASGGGWMPQRSYAVSMSRSASSAKQGKIEYHGAAFLHVHDGVKYRLRKNPKNKSGSFDSPEEAIKQAEILYKVAVDRGQMKAPEPGAPLAAAYQRRENEIAGVQEEHPDREVLPSGKLVPEGNTTCTKCGGVGILSQHSHVEGGVCFDCDGAGFVPEKKSKDRG